jgi:hypothetical protein
MATPAAPPQDLIALPADLLGRIASLVDKDRTAEDERAADYRAPRWTMASPFRTPRPSLALVDLPSLRAACRTFRDLVGNLVGERVKRHGKPSGTPRSAMLRTPALAAWAWELPGFRSAASGQMELCSLAARGGHLPVLQWLRANGCPWDESTCEEAAGGGHLAMLQWANANGCPWDVSTSTSAAAGGHLDVLQWANANGCPCNRLSMAIKAHNRRHSSA